MSIAEYRKLGYRSEGLCNYMSLLGWSPGNDQELFSFDELIKAFSVERIVKSPSIFDKAKLDWICGNHLRKLDPETYLGELRDYVLEQEILSQEEYEAKKDWYQKIFLLFQENISDYNQITEHLSLFQENFEYEDASILKQEGASAVLQSSLDALETKEVLDEAIFSDLMKEVKEKSGQKGKALFFPLRMALTGTVHGPELKQVVVLLGKEGCKERLTKALNV
jgi:glutamyl/glutaminyl-tRNA synthetase